jgi:hypothetical protein
LAMRSSTAISAFTDLDPPSNCRFVTDQASRIVSIPNGRDD